MTATAPTHPLMRYYVKTFDADDEFVREIRVEAGSSAEAARLANANLTSEERRIEVPLPFVPTSRRSSRPGLPAVATMGDRTAPIHERHHHVE